MGVWKLARQQISRALHRKPETRPEPDSQRQLNPAAEADPRSTQPYKKASQKETLRIGTPKQKPGRTSTKRPKTRQMADEAQISLHKDTRSCFGATYATVLRAVWKAHRGATPLCRPRAEANELQVQHGARAEPTSALKLDPSGGLQVAPGEKSSTYAEVG